MQYVNSNKKIGLKNAYLDNVFYHGDCVMFPFQKKSLIDSSFGADILLMFISKRSFCQGYTMFMRRFARSDINCSPISNTYGEMLLLTSLQIY